MFQHKNSIFFIAPLLFLTQLLSAQSWIPKDLQTTTLIIEQFKYYDPQYTLDDVDEEYEARKIEFLNTTNLNLDNYNEKADAIFKTYHHKYAMSAPGEINKLYPDVQQYRYILRREPFFGNKKVLNAASNTVEDVSYFAYRYYFHDRQTKTDYTPYYFSGDLWLQMQRLVFWMNKAWQQK
ncbi:MAG: hypothetical protein IPI59_01595 [Sphingobacteriales bacterium]|jgi:hypothetical protein|nr:hypothetical protein [Sphingobacteriales bacterium]MBP9142122.1 hypothetical protein [Chitinophagales bacterium]MDA0198634.1 hypothetical protein [Bacteroidota bacterium]MBK6890683.1 hypothetical protein [Sphingobacteriales bacterium]MBK7526264.1 hypothetical protein [Sphingobacteriales bacterium]